MTDSAAQRRLEALVGRVMPTPVTPCEVVCGEARVRAGDGEPLVRFIVRDKAAFKRLFLRHPVLIAFALAYADRAMDIEGDIFDVARTKDNFPNGPIPILERFRMAREFLRW